MRWPSSRLRDRGEPAMVGISRYEPGNPEEAQMTAADREAAARRQRARTIALWRWALIEPAMDAALTARQRGTVVRQLAAREHEGPSGTPVAVSRRTIDRWIVARREGGFEALVPSPRQCPPRAGKDTEELAAGLKMENPARTAAQVRRVLAAQLGCAPSVRTIQRWLEARELTTRPGGIPPRAYGRFQADRVNEIWTADLMNGPRVSGKATFLAGIIDDRSRFLTGARFVRRPDAVRFAGVLHGAIADYGTPQVLYTDNGSCYTDSSLQRVCAVLGIKLTHSAPGRPPLTDGQGQDRKGVRDYPAAVPGRGHRGRAAPGPPPRGGPGRAERPARQVGPDHLPLPGAFRDRGNPAGPV